MWTTQWNITRNKSRIIQFLHERNYYQLSSSMSMDDNNNNNSNTACDSLQNYWLNITNQGYIYDSCTNWIILWMVKKKMLIIIKMIITMILNATQSLKIQCFAIACNTVHKIRFRQSRHRRCAKNIIINNAQWSWFKVANYLTHVNHQIMKG